MRHARLHAGMLVALMLLSGLGAMAPALLDGRTTVASAVDIGDVTDSHEFGGDTVSIAGLVNANVREEAVLDRWTAEVLEAIEGNLSDGPHPVLRRGCSTRAGCLRTAAFTTVASGPTARGPPAV